MLENKTMGIKIPDNKTFYYIETGSNWIGNSVDRLKKTLIQRNLIKVNIDGTPSNYSICSYKQMKENHADYSIQPIFLSKHIEELYNAKQDTKSSSGLFKS